MAVTVRAAGPADLAGLRAIEFSGEAMFRRIGIAFPPGPATVETAIAEGAEIFVAGQLRAHWRAEIDAGLHELAPRLVMYHPGAEI